MNETASGLKRVLLTGGNGYVGSELIRRLKALGAQVFAIANRNDSRLVELLPPASIFRIAGDFPSIAELVRTLQPDAVMHLAAIHSEPPSFDEMMAMLDSSLRLGVALLHGASACPKPPVFLHSGTYWQFDGGTYSPNTFYAAAKQAFHDLGEYYRRVHSIPSTTLVLYDIYGPDDTRPKLWSKLLAAVPGSVFPMSEGRQLVELVHVSDIATAFLQAASLLLSGVALEPFQAIRSGVRITLRDLIEQVQERTCLDLKFEWGAIPYWPGQIFAPWQGPTLPNWRPLVRPVEGIVGLFEGVHPKKGKSTYASDVSSLSLNSLQESPALQA